MRQGKRQVSHQRRKKRDGFRYQVASIFCGAKPQKMEKKVEAASEVGVDLKQGYNGYLTSREAGSVGGQMVKKMCPVRNLAYTRESRISVGYEVGVKYIVSIAV